MSFFKDIQGKGPFNHKTNNSFERALSVLDHTVSSGFTPYTDSSSHAQSLLHPCLHATQLIRNATRLAYGTVVFASALLSLNSGAVFNALDNIAALILASALELLNVACSIISFATRSLASIFNPFYTSTNADLQQKFFNGTVCGGKEKTADIDLDTATNIAAFTLV